MLRNVIISPLNHIRFVPMDEVLPEKYHQPQFDKAWLSEYLMPGETKVKYGQPVEKKDPLDIQVHTTPTPSGETIQLYLVDCKRTIEIIRQFTLRTDAPQIINDGLQYFVHTLSDKEIFESLDDGTYYIYFRVPFDTDGTGGSDVYDWFISEPIIVRDQHLDTVLINASNSFNKDNIIFEQIKQKFRKRINGRITDMQPKVNRTVFIDQGENPTLLSATPTRTWKFVAGYTRGIPDYEIDKLNHYFALDGVYIEGKGYSTVEGSAIEKGSEGNYALHSGTIELTEKNAMSVYTFSKGGLTLLETLPSYPFEIYSTEVGYLNNVDYSYNAPTVIRSLIQLNSWISARNLEITNAGMEGEIALDGNTMVYQRGESETYDYATSLTLNHRLGVKMIADGANPLPVTLELSGSGLTIINNDARYSVYDPIGNVLSYGYAGYPVTSANGNWTSPSAGTYTYEIFHDGGLKTININGARVTGIDKYGSNLSVPSLLEVFGLYNSTIITAFSLWDELVDVRGTLVAFRLSDNPILTNTGIFYPLSAFANDGWRKLQYINLKGNAMNSSMIDQWYNSMRQAMLAPIVPPPALGVTGQFYVSNGIAQTNLQVPTASPTAASAVARNTLTVSFGWGLII